MKNFIKENKEGITIYLVILSLVQTVLDFSIPSFLILIFSGALLYREISEINADEKLKREAFFRNNPIDLAVAVVLFAFLVYYTKNDQAELKLLIKSL